MSVKRYFCFSVGQRSESEELHQEDRQNVSLPTLRTFIERQEQPSAPRQKKVSRQKPRIITCYFLLLSFKNIL